MINEVTTLACPVPVGQPLPRFSISATRSCAQTNAGRGFSTRSGAAEAARVRLGQRAKTGIDFILIGDHPEPGRWSWELPKASAAKRKDALKPGTIDARLVDMALRPEGVTRAEIRAELGWKSDPYPSLVTACDRAGVELSARKVGREQTRYRGRYL